LLPLTANGRAGERSLLVVRELKRWLPLCERVPAGGGDLRHLAEFGT
jgi:hypothetical protein